MHEDTEHLSLLFNLLVSIIDHIVNGFPNSSSGDLGEVFTSPATKKNMAMLKEPMEWLGPVFCNTVRPLLLVQGKWSYQVKLNSGIRNSKTYFCTYVVTNPKGMNIEILF